MSTLAVRFLTGVLLGCLVLPRPSRGEEKATISEATRDALAADYWRLLTDLRAGPPLILRAEINAQKLRIAELMKTLQWCKRLADRPGDVVVVPDTHALLHYLPIENLPWARAAHAGESASARVVLPFCSSSSLAPAAWAPVGTPDRRSPPVRPEQPPRG